MPPTTITGPQNHAEYLEVIARLGDIPAERIRMQPLPGTATEADVLAAFKGPNRRRCELVDGVLVEKAMGPREALLVGILVHLLWNYLEGNDLGQALPADAMLRLWPGILRIPDACFISWERLPEGQLPDTPVAEIVPDLAIEILSEGNTRQEMHRKMREYFQAGLRLVWIIDRKKQTAEEFTSPTGGRRVGKSGVLDGGDVLPGLRLSLSDLFSRTRRQPPEGDRK